MTIGRFGNVEGIEHVRILQGDRGAILAVKVVPGASRDAVVGVLGECLKIATSAPAEKGRANQAAAAILAKALGVDKRKVRLVSGRTHPRKEFRVAGLAAQRVRQILRRS